TRIGEAAKILDAEGVQALPIVNECGLYMGVVTRGDVIGALCLTIRPPSVGGLATPLGVYLTTGNHRGGTSDFGLFLTGVALGFLRYAAAALVAGVLWLVQKATGVGVLAMLIDQSAHKSQLADILSSSAIIIALVLFGVLLRISPLSGFHAAEHQVVNAIENGEPLKPEFVSRMPRVHPRCGTNLLVAVMIFLMIGDGFGNDVAVLLTIFVLIFAWRTIGGYFQNYVTTKPPTLRQIESGIRAGKEVVSSYRKNPALRVNGWRRIWYTGMPQVMAGMMLTTAFDTYLRGIFPGLF
ncbi:MAG TPA: DUF1385 domain-containing protein, partial [Armatimonadota bacterium]